MGFLRRLLGLESSADRFRAGNDSPNRFQVAWYEGPTVDYDKLATFGSWDAAADAARRKARELGRPVKITDYADVKTEKLEFFGNSMRTWQSYAVKPNGEIEEDPPSH